MSTKNIGKVVQVIGPVLDIRFQDGQLPELLSAIEIQSGDRKIVAEQFTGMEGKYVPLKETIRGFKEIIEGKHDDLPESAFLFVGTIEEAVEKAKKGE